MMRNGGDKMEVRIKLKVKDVEIELSLEELKEWKEVIEELTKKKIEYVYPQTVPIVPRYPTWPHWDILWDTTSTSITDNDTYTVMYKN